MTARSGPSTRRLGAFLAALLAISMAIPSAAGASQTQMRADNSGANGSIEGRVVMQADGRTTVVVRNLHQYWTNLDVSQVGVTLATGPVPGGVFAAIGVLAPGAEATWTATFDAAQPASALVRASPYLLSTNTGGLAAALNILDILAEMLGDKAPDVATLADSAAKVTRAVALVRTVFGDRLTKDFTVEGFASGDLAADVFDALSEKDKAEILSQALSLLGVGQSAAALGTVAAHWAPAVGLLQLIWDMGSALILGQSSGGVLFDYAPPSGLTPPVTTPPSPPVTTPPSPPVTTAPSPPAGPSSSAPPTSAPPTRSTPTAPSPSDASIAGTHPMHAKLTKCVGLNDCQEPFTRTWTPAYVISDCARTRCMIIDPQEWVSAVPLTYNGTAWTAVGQIRPDLSFGCYNSPRPSPASIRLKVTAARLVNGVWTATAFSGSVVESAAATSQCGRAEFDWTLAS
jgi:hypothetical protein